MSDQIEGFIESNGGRGRIAHYTSIPVEKGRITHVFMEYPRWRALWRLLRGQSLYALNAMSFDGAATTKEGR